MLQEILSTRGVPALCSRVEMLEILQWAPSAITSAPVCTISGERIG